MSAGQRRVRPTRRRSALNAVGRVVRGRPLNVPFIIEYNYVCSLVPIIYELLLQYLVRNEIRVCAQIKIV